MPLLQRRIQFGIAGICGQIVVKSLAASWRVSSHFPRDARKGLQMGRATGIFVFWHRHLLSLLGRFSGYRVCVPVSEHTDGEYVAQVMERCGLLAVRGSSSHGQLKLVRGLLRAIEDGRSCAISPDGPRGPCYSVQPGFILLARRTGLPVYPLGVSVGDGWELNSWDSFVIPKPFTQIGVYCDEPIPADELSNQSIDESCERVKDRLMEAGNKAEGRISGG